MTNNVPNLDALDNEDCMSFWSRHQQGRAFRKIFPEGGKGTKRATADLANYASNIATAKRLRASGQIDAAFQYELIAERIYDDLPRFARF